MSLNCTDSLGLSCNFAFDVSVPPHQFYDLLKKEVDLLYPSPSDFVVFKLTHVSLSEWFV